METPASTSRWSNEPLSSPPNCLQPWQVTNSSRSPQARQPRTPASTAAQDPQHEPHSAFAFSLTFLADGSSSSPHKTERRRATRRSQSNHCAPRRLRTCVRAGTCFPCWSFAFFFLPGRLQCRSPLGRPVRVFLCLPDARVVCRCDWPHCVTALPAPQAAQEVERHNSGLIRHSLVLLSV